MEEESNIVSCGINYLPFFADDVKNLGQSVSSSTGRLENMGQLTIKMLKIK